MGSQEKWVAPAEGLEVGEAPTILYRSLPEKYEDVNSRQQNIICGLRKRTFWIVAPLGILVILGAAIGGGVGGGLLARSSSDKCEFSPLQFSYHHVDMLEG